MDSAPATLRDLIREGIVQRMFPGAAAYVARGGRPLLHEAFGTTTWAPPALRPIGLADRFDLASLTKLYTTALALRLVERGILRLGDEVRRQVPEVGAAWTLEDLLAHRTGTTAGLLGEALRHGIRPCEPGQERALWSVIFACRAEVELARGQSHYSDIDFLLAQAACERATGRGLADLMAGEVLEPLGLRETRFCPAEPERCVPTEVDDTWRHRLVVGEVHDEVASTLGGVAGHAGLFATAADVGRFCEAWLGLSPSAFLSERMARLALKAHSDSFGLGWRLCNASFFPLLEAHGAVGHLGFTGTSAFLFPRAATVFVLLTNRVHPHRDVAPSRLPLLGRMAATVGAWAAGEP